jgi:hypothetical protein
MVQANLIVTTEFSHYLCDQRNYSKLPHYTHTLLPLPPPHTQYRAGEPKQAARRGARDQGLRHDGSGAEDAGHRAGALQSRGNDYCDCV